MFTGALALQPYENAATAVMTSRTGLAQAGWSLAARQRADVEDCRVAPTTS
jgi:hypothetical protein